MNSLPATDEDPVRRLPLLPQLYRRVHSAKAAREHQLTAHYLSQAALELLPCVVVVGYAERGGHDPHPVCRVPAEVNRRPDALRDKEPELVWRS